MPKDPEIDATLNRRLSAVNHRMAIEEIKSDVRLLGEMAASVPLWRPANTLKIQCRDIFDILEHIEQRLEHKLVVTLIGPTGSGKSTLLNALAGSDDLSAVGHQRPTTRGLVVWCRRSTDAAQLTAEMDAQTLEIRTHRGAQALEHAMLIDTPDTDSMERDTHLALVRQAVSLSDVLICVFDAENPKRMDHVDFLADLVNHFHGDSLGVVLNKCDRLEATELQAQIVPDFSAYLAAAWNVPVNSVLCISARRNLQHPRWDEGVRPRHDFDQFYLLREMVFGHLNNEGVGVQRRLDNAVSLGKLVRRSFGSAVAKHRQQLEQAAEEIPRTEKAALQAAATALGQGNQHQPVGMNLLLYQRLAQRWLGPVGWVVAMWARLLIFGTGMLAMFRFGRPLRQLLAMVSALTHGRDRKEAMDETTRGDAVAAALRAHRLTFMRQWPPIGNTLVAAGFEPAVLDVEAALPDTKQLGQVLAERWQDALDQVLDNAAGKLSHLMLQVVFNLPVLVVLAMAGWRTTRDFVQGHYLSGDFFLHAFLAVGFTLALCFFLLQIIVRMLAGPDRLARLALQEVQKAASLQDYPPMTAIERQIATVLSLGDPSRPPPP